MTRVAVAHSALGAARTAVQKRLVLNVVFVDVLEREPALVGLVRLGFLVLGLGVGAGLPQPLHQLLASALGNSRGIVLEGLGHTLPSSRCALISSRKAAAWAP